MGGGLTNERPGTDHVISGPMRGLKKHCIRWRRHTNKHTHTDGHCNSMTESAQWGRFSEKTIHRSKSNPIYFMSLK